MNTGREHTMKTVLTLLGAVCLVGANPLQAADAFWSFDSWRSGDGMFAAEVTAHEFAETPSLVTTGTQFLTSGGAAEFTAFNGTTWLGSGRADTPGHCLGWLGGSTGNTLSLTLKSSTLANVHVRMDIRAYGFAKGASFTGLFIDAGKESKPVRVTLKSFSRPGEFDEWTVDLAGLSELQGRNVVTLKWILPDIPSGGSLRLDNLQITTK